jgi:multidrug efflux pump
MAAYGLTPQDVEDALKQQNVELPSGRIESRQREFSVLTESDLRTPEQFNDLILKETKGYPIRCATSVTPKSARRTSATRAGQRQSLGGAGRRQAVHRQHAERGAVGQALLPGH